ncbi:MAG TPA: hypothetical protein VFK02_13635 [Kofleriaceae bacterium]|nr:hypothetical protein [Kofleriaceae bacterium]
MKIANLFIFIAALAIALTTDPAALHAQATNASLTAGGEDKPWNRGVSHESRQVARDLFLEGNRLFRVPLFGRAAEQYAAALHKWRHPAFYFNLALAQLNAGQEVEARDNLERALVYGEEPLGAEQYQEAQKQLRELEAQLGRIRIRCATPGTEVRLDGIAVLPHPGSYVGWVKAKTYELTAKSDGYISEARRVVVAAGKLQDVELRLVTLSEATDTSRRWATWKPWAVFIAGSAMVATAGVVHVVSSRNFNAYDEKFLHLECARTTGCTDDDIGPALSAQLDRARLQQQIAVGGYIAGGAVLATGIVLLYMNRPRLLEQGGKRPSPVAVTIVPMATPEALGIWASFSH